MASHPSNSFPSQNRSGVPAPKKLPSQEPPSVRECQASLTHSSEASTVKDLVDLPMQAPLGLQSRQPHHPSRQAPRQGLTRTILKANFEGADRKDTFGSPLPRCSRFCLHMLLRKNLNLDVQTIPVPTWVLLSSSNLGDPLPGRRATK